MHAEEAHHKSMLVGVMCTGKGQGSGNKQQGSENKNTSRNTATIHPQSVYCGVVFGWGCIENPHLNHTTIFPCVFMWCVYEIVCQSHMGVAWHIFTCVSPAPCVKNGKNTHVKADVYRHIHTTWVVGAHAVVRVDFSCDRCMSCGFIIHALLYTPTHTPTGCTPHPPIARQPVSLQPATFVALYDAGSNSPSTATTIPWHTSNRGVSWAPPAHALLSFHAEKHVVLALLVTFTLCWVLAV